jgi:hypothetical protein
MSLWRKSERHALLRGVPLAKTFRIGLLTGSRCSVLKALNTEIVSELLSQAGCATSTFSGLTVLKNYEATAPIFCQVLKTREVFRKLSSSRPPECLLII